MGLAETTVFLRKKEGLQPVQLQEIHARQALLKVQQHREPRKVILVREQIHKPEPIPARAALQHEAVQIIQNQEL